MTDAALAPAAKSPSLSTTILCLTGFLVSVDRLAFPIVIEPIRIEFGLSDTQVGLMTGLAFYSMYVAAALPMARWADRGDRRVVIALGIGVWSIMTAVCGMAQSAWQLFFARFGVGFGEAGSNAPVGSLISAYYPPERRSLPMALFGLGSALGGVLGFVVVGIAADRIGWRNALIVLSVPGLLLAMAIRLWVYEPRAAATGRTVAISPPPLMQALATMLRKRSFVHVSIGFAIWGIAATGTGQWLPSYLIRTYAMSMTQTGLLLALLGGGLCAGLVVGGVFGNRLLARDLRWGLQLPALGMLCYAVATIGALLAPSLTIALILFFIGSTVGGLVVAPLLATVSGLVPQDIRTLALALMGLMSALFGGGLGPLAIGAISDGLNPTFGAASLGYSLAAATLLMLWGALHLYLASRHLLGEFEDRVPVFPSA